MESTLGVQSGDSKVFVYFAWGWAFGTSTKRYLVFTFLSISLVFSCSSTKTEEPQEDFSASSEEDDNAAFFSEDDDSLDISSEDIEQLHPKGHIPLDTKAMIMQGPNHLMKNLFDVIKNF